MCLMDGAKVLLSGREQNHKSEHAHISVFLRLLLGMSQKEEYRAAWDPENSNDCICEFMKRLCIVICQI